MQLRSEIGNNASNFFSDDLIQATLKVRGKALSSEQKVKVVTKAQTENPLYLKTLLEVRKLLFITGFVMEEKIGIK